MARKCVGEQLREQKISRKLEASREDTSKRRRETALKSTDFLRLTNRSIVVLEVPVLFLQVLSNTSP